MKKIKNDFDLKDLVTDYGFKFVDTDEYKGYIYKNNVICVEYESREIEVNIKNADDLEKVKELYDDGVIASRDDLIKEWMKKHDYEYYTYDNYYCNFLFKDKKRIYVNNLRCSLRFDADIEPNELDKRIAEYKKEMQELENDVKSLKEYLGE